MSTAAAAAPAVLSAQADVTDICCIGAGYVGAITMTIIAQHCPEIKIVVVDVNQAKIDQWNSDDLPLFEPGLKEIIMSCRGTICLDVFFFFSFFFSFLSNDFNLSFIVFNLICFFSS